MKTLRRLLFACLAIVSIVACDNQDEPVNTTVPVNSIAIEPSGSLTAVVGDSITFTATVLPEDATDKEVTWTSSNPELASIDNNGVMSAKAAGCVTITAAAGAMSASVEVTITDAYVAVTDILTNVEGDSLTMYWGETFQLELSVVPENATEQTITFSFLRIDENGEAYEIPESEYMTITEDGLITTAEWMNSRVIEGLVLTAGEYSENLMISIGSGENTTLPEGWIRTENGVAYGDTEGALSTTGSLIVEKAADKCSSALFTIFVREATAEDINGAFPDAVVESFTITGRGTVATIELLKVAGCKEYFEGLTVKEMLDKFGGNEAKILESWSDGFVTTKSLGGKATGGMWTMSEIGSATFMIEASIGVVRMEIQQNPLKCEVDRGVVKLNITDASLLSIEFIQFLADNPDVVKEYKATFELQIFIDYMYDNYGKQLQILDGYKLSELVGMGNGIYNDFISIVLK